jgi:transcriptional regulator with XRE-family HTH domain
MPAVALADALREQIRELMEAKGLDQKDLAKAVGKSQGYVSMILSGQRLGNEMQFLERLARQLDRNLSTLVQEAERRDLLRHARTGSSGSHQSQGVSDVPASDRLREVERTLERERREHAALIAEIQSAVGKLFQRIASTQSTEAPAREPKVRRAHRRTG